MEKKGGKLKKERRKIKKWKGETMKTSKGLFVVVVVVVVLFLFALFCFCFVCFCFFSSLFKTTIRSFSFLFFNLSNGNFYPEKAYTGVGGK